MKITLGNLQPDALPRSKGIYLTRSYRGGAVVQKWPTKQKKPFTDAQRCWQIRFAFAARMASSPYFVEYETALFLSKGTMQVPRDLLTAAALGRQYTIEWPFGGEWGHVEGCLASPFQ